MIELEGLQGAARLKEAHPEVSVSSSNTSSSSRRRRSHSFYMKCTMTRVGMKSDTLIGGYVAESRPSLQVWSLIQEHHLQTAGILT